MWEVKIDVIMASGGVSRGTVGPFSTYGNAEQAVLLLLQRPVATLNVVIVKVAEEKEDGGSGNQ